MSLYPDSPPFDANAVDALPFYGRQVAFVIEDDDPNPNIIRKLLISTHEGAWTVELAAGGVWEVDGQAVGEKTQRECEMAVAFQEADSRDLREFQGAEAAARYSR